MDKQSNEKVYLKKCLTLCITLLCVYGIPKILVRIFFALFSAQSNLQWFKTALTVISFLESYALIACAILLIVFLFKRSRTCKNCMAWNSMKEINVELVDRQDTIVKKTMQSKTEITDWTGMETLGTATTTTTYDAPAEYRTYRHTFRCSQCGCTTHSNRSALFGA